MNAFVVYFLDSVTRFLSLVCDPVWPIIGWCGAELLASQPGLSFSPARLTTFAYSISWLGALNSQATLASKNFAGRFVKISPVCFYWLPSIFIKLMLRCLHYLTAWQNNILLQRLRYRDKFWIFLEYKNKYAVVCIWVRNFKFYAHRVASLETVAKLSRIDTLVSNLATDAVLVRMRAAGWAAKLIDITTAPLLWTTVKRS